MRVAVVGSGPTGIAAAMELVQAGLRVDVLDGGEAHERPEFVEDLARTVRSGRPPSRSQVRQLRYGPQKPRLSRMAVRSVQLLAGSIQADDLEKRILGSTFTFRAADKAAPLTGPWLPRSLAVGGLANAWGAACYTLRTEDYADWPLEDGGLDDGFARASELLDLSGEVDALANVYPVLGPLRAACGRYSRDPGSVFEALLGKWAAQGDHLAGLGIRAGRSRLAVRLAGSGRTDCARCGLCSFGCPTGAIWTPATLLRAGARGIQHLTGRIVEAVENSGDGVILRGISSDGRAFHTRPYASVFLAAGALASLRIAAKSMGASVTARVLENAMFILPLKVERGIEGRGAPVRFSLSEAVWAFDPGTVGRRPAHLQLYRVTEPLLGPLGRLLGLLPAWANHRLLKGLSGYVIGFLYLHSSDSAALEVRLRPDNFVLETAARGERNRNETLNRALDLLDEAAPITGLRPVRRLARVAPPGFSAHLGGTLPVSSSPERFTSRPDGSIRGLERVYVVDLGALPAIPAQNATLTGMANAIRVARLLSRELVS
jgi:choline dehydrogenase-like flavoprotein